MWGPLPTSATELWEISLLENPSIPVRHFYAPFDYSRHSVRLRAIPDDGLAATILAAVPFGDESTVNMVTFFKQQSVFSGRDSFVIDGEELLTEERAAADDTIIAMFHFDSGSDGVSGDDPVQFGSFPFMAGTDSVWEADAQDHFEVQFNGQSRVLPKCGVVEWYWRFTSFSVGLSSRLSKMVIQDKKSEQKTLGQQRLELDGFQQNPIPIAIHSCLGDRCSSLGRYSLVSSPQRPHHCQT